MVGRSVGWFVAWFVCLLVGCFSLASLCWDLPVCLMYNVVCRLVRSSACNCPSFECMVTQSRQLDGFQRVVYLAHFVCFFACPLNCRYRMYIYIYICMFPCVDGNCEFHQAFWLSPVQGTIVPRGSRQHRAENATLKQRRDASVLQTLYAASGKGISLIRAIFNSVLVSEQSHTLY